MSERTIPFLKESENGHDTTEVPESKLAEEINKELADKKWVTVEKKDGTSEILTSAAPPKEEEPTGEDEDGTTDTGVKAELTPLQKLEAQNAERKAAEGGQTSLFGKKTPDVKPTEVKSVTSTKPLKGG